MSLIDEALRRAQSARTPGGPAPAGPDSWSGAPLPDRARSRRRARAAMAVAAAVLLLGGASAFLLLRGGAAPELPAVARMTAGGEQPHGQAALDRAKPTPTPGARAAPPARAASPRPAASPTTGASVAAQGAAPEPPLARSQPPVTPTTGAGVAAPATAPLASESSLPIRSASSSPGIAAHKAPVRVPSSRVHAPPEAASERERPVHVGEVSVPGGHIELGGIAFSDTNPVALLNGRVIGVGGTVEGFTVVSIQESRVELTNDQRTIVLTLR